MSGRWAKTRLLQPNGRMTKQQNESEKKCNFVFTFVLLRISICAIKMANRLIWNIRAFSISCLSDVFLKKKRARYYLVGNYICCKFYEAL